jgi:hypothetical protein
VTDLSTEVIAIRAGLSWLIGLAGTGLIHGLLLRLPGGRRSTWWIVPILASRIALLLGPVGVGLIVGRLIPKSPENIVLATAALALIASLWLSAIAAQLVQNRVSTHFGLKPEPIRWWAGDTGKRSRKRQTRTPTPRNNR